MTAYDRRIYSGNAKATTISSSIGSGDTSIGCGDLTGWPDGSGTKRAFATIEVDGNASQERITYTGKSGNTLTGVTRGADDTSAATHLAGAQIIHSHSKTDLDEANAHVTDTTRDDHTQYTKKSILTTKGDILAATASATPARVAVGSDGTALIGDSASAAGVKFGYPLGALLGVVQYAPGSGVFFSVTQDNTVRALDATNLALTFTIPASGKVMAVQQCSTSFTNDPSILRCFMGILVHGSSTQVGSLLMLPTSDSSGGFFSQTVMAGQYVTGLTPGSVTWDFAVKLVNSNYNIVKNEALGAPTFLAVYAA